jgi:hypothetical protein
MDLLNLAGGTQTAASLGDGGVLESLGREQLRAHHLQTTAQFDAPNTFTWK